MPPDEEELYCGYLSPRGFYGGHEQPLHSDHYHGVNFKSVLRKEESTHRHVMASLPRAGIGTWDTISSNSSRGRSTKGLWSLLPIKMNLWGMGGCEKRREPVQLAGRSNLFLVINRSNSSGEETRMTFPFRLSSSLFPPSLVFLVVVSFAFERWLRYAARRAFLDCFGLVWVETLSSASSTKSWCREPGTTPNTRIWGKPICLRMKVSNGVQRISTEEYQVMGNSSVFPISWSDCLLHLLQFCWKNTLIKERGRWGRVCKQVRRDEREGECTESFCYSSSQADEQTRAFGQTALKHHNWYQRYVGSLFCARIVVRGWWWENMIILVLGASGRGSKLGQRPSPWTSQWYSRRFTLATTVDRISEKQEQRVGIGTW